MCITKYNEKETMAAFAAEAYEEGVIEGKTELLIQLVKDGLIFTGEAAKRMNVSEKSFISLL